MNRSWPCEPEKAEATAYAKMLWSEKALVLFQKQKCWYGYSLVSEESG